MANEEEHSNIIRGCRQKDRKAQEALYKAYYKAMVTICLRYTKNEDDALEVLNSGFLKVFQNIQRYEPAQASLYTWIRTIVVNSCLDFIRKKARTTQHHELDNATEVHVPAEAISRMKANELLALVRSLPPSTAAVFNLYVIEGYSHKEIGSLLGISDGTSKWHLSEARKQLQQKIKLQDINT
ncbi:MAG TPA: sigma-70 family RNA polymerase sigma factor [Flavisolibacter sp.]